MDYSKLFGPTFFVALTFLGIVVPIFSLSVSLLGHAVEKAKEKSIKRRTDAEQELQNKFNNLESELKKIRGTEDKIAASQNIELELSQLRKSRKNFEKQSTKIIKRYDQLKFKEGILVPGFLFIFAIIFSSLSQILIIPITIKVSWAFSLVLITIGIYRICSNLSIIQEVALSSDKYQQERMYEAISKAFETQMQSAQPELGLIFKTPSPPFKFPKLSEISLSFKVNLKKGKFAKNVKVLFVISKEFDFVNVKKKWNQEADRRISNGLSTYYEIGDVRSGIFQPGTITVKTPSVPGKYELGYVLSSEESSKSEFLYIEII